MKLMISQPTFCPWLGYFDMIDQSDLYVILDDVDFAYQSWQHRNNFITDTGKGGFYIGTSCSYTLDDSHEFNKNMEKANFAKLKQKQSKNYSNNTYYTEYFWHVNNDVIKPLEGFYKSSSVKESWKKICFNNRIVDGDSYKKFLEN